MARSAFMWVAVAALLAMAMTAHAGETVGPAERLMAMTADDAKVIAMTGLFPKAPRKIDPFVYKSGNAWNQPVEQPHGHLEMGPAQRMIPDRLEENNVRAWIAGEVKGVNRYFPLPNQE